jgi:hypothetical protein
MSRKSAPIGLVTVVILFSFFIPPAGADDLWIAPGERTEVAVGNWGMTAAGTARFSFAVPDNLDTLDGAQVLVIGKKTRQITYTLQLSISGNGLRHDAFTDSDVALPAAVQSEVLTALDASSVFPSSLNPGEDVVTLHFLASSTVDVRVVGLWLQFTPIPPTPSQAGLACGPREVLVGFAAATGTPICVGRSLLLEGLLCPPRQFLIGFDPVTGSMRCGDKRVLLAGISCPPGEVLVGFDDFDGNPVCKTLGEVAAEASP